MSNFKAFQPSSNFFTVLPVMAKCSYCGIEFPLLADNENEASVRCGKCTLQVPGLSIPELAVVNVRLIHFSVHVDSTKANDKL